MSDNDEAARNQKEVIDRFIDLLMREEDGEKMSNYLQFADREVVVGALSTLVSAIKRYEIPIGLKSDVELSCTTDDNGKPLYGYDNPDYIKPCPCNYLGESVFIYHVTKPMSNTDASIAQMIGEGTIACLNLTHIGGRAVFSNKRATVIRRTGATFIGDLVENLFPIRGNSPEYLFVKKASDDKEKQHTTTER